MARLGVPNRSARSRPQIEEAAASSCAGIPDGILEFLPVAARYGKERAFQPPQWLQVGLHELGSAPMQSRARLGGLT